MSQAADEVPDALSASGPGPDLAEAVEQALLGNGGQAEQDDPSEEALRDGYTEARADARAFIDLRFKHFTTFAVLLGIGALAASRSELQQERPGIAAVMLVMTLLFRSIDGRALLSTTAAFSCG
jgi:hypothetical protein